MSKRDAIIAAAPRFKGMPSVDSSGKQAQPGSARSFSGVSLGGERSETARPSIDGDLGYPLHCAPLQVNASEPGRRAGLAGHILAVDTAGSGPEVDSTVIEFVSVDMVYLSTISVLQSKQLSVQTYRSNSAIVTSHMFATDYITVSAQAPSPSTGPFGIGSVHHCVSAHRSIASTERDTYGILKAHREASLPGVTPGC
jgi:hypothetical protein